MAIHLTRDEKAKRYDALQVAIKTEREAFMQREKDALQKYKDASIIGAYNKGLADAYEQAVDSLGRWIE